MPRDIESFQRNPEESFDKKEGEFKEAPKEGSVERFNRTGESASYRIKKSIKDKNWDKAIAEALAVEKGQEMFLSDIITAQIHVGAFDEAKQLVKKYEDEKECVRFLRSIGIVQARKGFVDDAIVSFNEAKQVAGKLKDKISRVSDLRYIGSEQAKGGLIDEAKKTVEELKAESGKEDGYLSEVYGAIATAEAESGQIESAKEYVAKIEKINGYGVDSAYQAIAEAELNSGLVDDAKTTVKKINNYKVRNNVSSEISRAEEKSKKLRHGPYR